MATFKMDQFACWEDWMNVVQCWHWLPVWNMSMQEVLWTVNWPHFLNVPHLYWNHINEKTGKKKTTKKSERIDPSFHQLHTCNKNSTIEAWLLSVFTAHNHTLTFVHSLHSFAKVKGRESRGSFTSVTIKI